MTTKTYTEQERADFEAFATPRGYDLDAEMLMSKPPKFSRYTNPATQHAFEAYQAGRASLQSQDRKDAERLKLRLDTIRALYPNAPSDAELDEAIDHARRIEGEGE